MDESFDPQALLSEARGQKVILNLKGVTRLSSFGVREWTYAMRELCNRVEHVYFVEVSPAVVTQLNMVANFAGAAHVLSVQAPFYCDCGFETEVTYDLRDGTVNLGSVKCRECGSPMSFDDDPDAYFQYPLENARSKPMDPNIDVFLRHLSEGFQDDGGGMRSFPPPSEGTSPGSRISQLPQTIAPHGGSIPGVSLAQVRSGSINIGGIPQVQTYAHSQDLPLLSQQPRPPAVWMKAKSVLLGLSIPTVLAALIVALWPAGGSGSNLPDDVKHEYQEHFQEGRYGEAAALIRRLERQKKLEPDAALRAKNEIKSAALGPFSEHLEHDHFAEAAQLVTQAARERVVEPRDSTRMHKEVMGRATAQHRALLAGNKISEAEELAENLSREGVLPTALRRSFQNDVAADRQQLTQKLQTQATDAVEAKHWQDVVDACKLIARIGPPPPDVDFMHAEAYRHLNKDEEAAVHYQHFIDSVEKEEPPHDGLDDALYYRGKWLASNGKRDEAKQLLQRVAAMPNSRHKESAQKFLER